MQSISNGAACKHEEGQEMTLFFIHQGPLPGQMRCQNALFLHPAWWM